jgi:arylsulfatase
MLTNADANFGRLEAFLAERGLRDDTIVVFFSDNGGYALVDRYNAGMRGGKSRLTEGGHRVPCFVRWPAGGVGGEAGGRDVGGLTQVQDLAPTLLELCAVEKLPGPAFDGVSLAAPLRGEGAPPERTLVVQYGQPAPFHMTCVLRGDWRLLSDVKGLAKGEPELYHLGNDPLQRTNLIDREPEIARELRAYYDQWWSEVQPQTLPRASISIGHPAQAETVLSAAEWRQNAVGAQRLLREGIRRRGVWDVEVHREGMYQVELRRWPEEAGLAIRAAAPPWTPRDDRTPDHAGYPAAPALPIASAFLRVGPLESSTPVAEEDQAALFHLRLPVGRTEIEAFFRDEAGRLVTAAGFVTLRSAP